MTATARKQLTVLHWIAIFEGLSLILLFFVAMPLKYFMGMPEAVSVIGLIHGILFMVYVAALTASLHLLRWSWGKIAWGYIASSVPFGTFMIRFEPDAATAPAPKESTA